MILILIKLQKTNKTNILKTHLILYIIYNNNPKLFLFFEYNGLKSFLMKCFFYYYLLLLLLLLFIIIIIIVAVFRII